METIELLVYIVVACAVGALFLLFLQNADLVGIGDEVSKTMLNERDFSFKTVDWDGFCQELLAFWNEHMFSDNKAEMTLYVDEQGILDKELLFETVKQSNLCRTMQSKAFDCGTREDVRLGSLQLPQVIRIVYENNTIIISDAEITAGANHTLQIISVPFAGFEGNGELTRVIQGIPAGAEVVSMRLALIAASDFTLLFNGQECRELMVYPGENVWDITECSAMLTSDNLMTFRFKSDDFWRQYVAGGLLTILYDFPNEPAAQQRIPLPSIDKSVSYFGGVTLPAPQSLDICLHYWVGDLRGYDFYVTVNGNKVYQDFTSNHEQPLTCTHVDAGLLQAGINPIRIGVSSQTQTVKNIFIPQPVDAVLITDQSGSMDCDLDNLIPQMCQADPAIGGGDLGDPRNNNCNDVNLLSDQTQKLILAKCFGRDFVEIILKTYDKNRIGLVSFHQRVEDSTVLDLTSDSHKLEDTLMLYEPSGATCLSCAIEKGREILNKTPKQKAMVIMTDGIANHCIPGVECSEAQAAQEAFDQATEAFNGGIALFTIAFGLNEPQGRQLLQDIACIDNCSNFGEGDTPDKIKEVYRKFAERIAEKLTFVTRFAQGSPEEIFIPSRLYSDSYIEVSPVPPTTSGLRLIVAKRLDCPDSFDIPSNLEITDCNLNSIAGKDWTDKITLNANVIYDLTQYSSVSYYQLGDPSVLGLPLDQLMPRNTIEVMAGYAGAPQAECLANNTVYYTARVPQAIIAQKHFKSAEGCHWTLSFPDSQKVMTIPPTYRGDNLCSYGPNIEYSPEDKYQFATATLLGGLDSDYDGVVDDSFDEVHVLG